MKVCRKCGVEKEDAAFRKNRLLRDGLHSWCRVCSYDAHKEFKAKHPGWQAEQNAKARKRRLGLKRLK